MKPMKHRGLITHLQTQSGPPELISSSSQAHDTSLILWERWSPMREITGYEAICATFLAPSPTITEHRLLPRRLDSSGSRSYSTKYRIERIGEPDIWYTLGKVVTEFGQEIVDAYYERLTEHRARPSPRPMLETSPKQSLRKIVSRACDLCVNRKSKCDNGQPCQQCRKQETQCVFTRKRKRPAESIDAEGKNETLALSEQ